MVDVLHCCEQDENAEPVTHKQTKIKKPKVVPLGNRTGDGLG